MKKTKKDYLFLTLLISMACIFLALLVFFSSSFYLHFTLLSKESVDDSFSLGSKYLEERLLSDLGDYKFDSFVFSRDGQNFALIEEENESQCVILNDRNLGCYKSVKDLIFSPKGNSFAYIIKDDNKARAIVNYEEGDLYDWILPPYFFNEDGRIFVYRAKNRSEEMVVVNDQVSYSYDKILDIFPVTDKDTIVFYALKNNKLWRGEINY